MAMSSERKSFCRLCFNHCGVVVTVDDEEQIVSIKPDREDITTRGFACYKGLQAGGAHRSEERLLYPLKRNEQGSFERIGWEQALDEIAGKIGQIVQRDGAEAVGGMRGGGAGLNSIGWPMLETLLFPLGSRKLFSITTIDQSAKAIAAERIGMWPAGVHPLTNSDVLLMIGMNPLVSLQWFHHDPMRTMKADLARGMKLLVVDPRNTETAQFAHVYLQPLPGEDATIVAGMIRLILANGWEDKAFVSAHVSQLDELRRAVEPFTPEYVARRARVPVEDFVELVEIFAKTPRGRAQSGTGANMGPHSNLVEHLVYSLNVICGRFIREGERIGNPGVLMPRYPRPCQVIPASRSWETGYRSRLGYGLITGELPTGTMADEILTPGPGRVRAFIAHGSNPGVVVPDQERVVEAFKSLELMVTIDVSMTATAQLSHYILPDLMQYEREDLPMWAYESMYYEAPFTRYTAAVSKPPPGSDLRADEYIFWSLAKRLGIQMNWQGVDLDMDRPPTKDEMLAIVARNAPVDFEQLKTMELGGLFPGEPQFAEAGDPGPEHRFTLAPPEVIEELAQLAAEDFDKPAVVANGKRATHRFTVRRHRDMFNSTGHAVASIRKRLPYNTARVHSGDLADLGIASGSSVKITSETSAVVAVVEADDTLRPGVLSMLHGFGGLPGQTQHRRDGACSNRLISTQREMQPINAMPRMTAFPVHVEAVDNDYEIDTLDVRGEGPVPAS